MTKRTEAALDNIINILEQICKKYGLDMESEAVRLESDLLRLLKNENPPLIKHVEKKPVGFSKN